MRHSYRHIGHLGTQVAVSLILAAGLVATAETSAQAPSAASLRPVHLASSNSPGLGRANWQLLTFDQSAAAYFGAARMARNGNAAVGWFTQVFAVARDYPNIAVSGVQFQQNLVWANCTEGSYAIREFAWYDAAGKLIPQSTYLVSNPEFVQPASNSIAAEEVGVLCGSLAGKASVSSDGIGLLSDYRQRLARPVSEGAAPHTVAKATIGAEPGKPTAIAGNKPPGLGKATWHVVTSADDFVEYYTTTSIKRNGKLAQGWFTDVYPEPLTAGPASGIVFIQSLVEANCVSSKSKVLRTTSFGIDRASKADEVVTKQSFEASDPDSIAGDQVNALCGKRTELSGTQPFAGDGEQLREFTRVLMQIHKQDQGK